MRKYAVLGIETLNVRGMDKLRGQARGVRDAAFGGLLAKVRYKAEWYGTLIVAASQAFPSSKLCSACGEYNGELKGKRPPRWACPSCDVIHDRNENAATNLYHLALGAVSSDVTLPDGKALADGNHAAGETGPDEGRTEPQANYGTQLALGF